MAILARQRARDSCEVRSAVRKGDDNEEEVEREKEKEEEVEKEEEEEEEGVEKEGGEVEKTIRGDIDIDEE